MWLLRGICSQARSSVPGWYPDEGSDKLEDLTSLIMLK